MPIWIYFFVFTIGLIVSFAGNKLRGFLHIKPGHWCKPQYHNAKAYLLWSIGAGMGMVLLAAVLVSISGHLLFV